MLHLYGQMFRAESKSYGIFHQDYYDFYTNLGRNATYLQSYISQCNLTINPSQTPDCAPNNHECEDTSCRTHIFICTSDHDWSPKTCACRVTEKLRYDMFFCRWDCTPNECSCPPLLFQCSAGGCISYLYICDRKSHCTDSSDEFCENGDVTGSETSGTSLFHKPLDVSVIRGVKYCLGFKCKTGECIDKYFENDLIPDCSDGDDEYHMLYMRRGKVYNCNEISELPCILSHSKCLSVNHLCVYDHDVFGHIAYCRDGAHLFTCEDIEYTNTFKCPRSYCIPLRMVCDGVDDCLEGQDEFRCDNYTCPGYLKCHGVAYCVHLWEICDGFPKRPTADNETLYCVTCNHVLEVVSVLDTLYSAEIAISHTHHLC